MDVAERLARPQRRILHPFQPRAAGSFTERFHGVVMRYMIDFVREKIIVPRDTQTQCADLAAAATHLNVHIHAQKIAGKTVPIAGDG